MAMVCQLEGCAEVLRDGDLRGGGGRGREVEGGLCRERIRQQGGAKEGEGEFSEHGSILKE